jgi:hypothetical protein
VNEILGTLLQALLIIGGVVLLAVVGFAVVHRLIAVHIRHAHNDVAGFIYAVVGIMYAILLAYVTIIVWEQYNSATSLVEQEATNAYNIYHEVDEFPDPNRSQVQGSSSLTWRPRLTKSGPCWLAESTANGQRILLTSWARRSRDCP